MTSFREILKQFVKVIFSSKNGLLWLGDKKGTQLRSTLASRYGIKHEVLNNREITARFPHLNYETGPEDAYWWGIYEPTGGEPILRIETFYKEL